MSQRLRPRDLALLAHESPTTPMHNATVEIFDPGDSGFDHDRLRRADRGADLLRPPLPAAGCSRCPGGWPTRPGSTTPTSTSPSTYAAPRCRVRAAWTSCASWSPGSCPARSTASRPLWEVYLVEGLDDGRVAVLWKSHLALVDGVDTVDLGQVLLDPRPELRPLGGDEWLPGQRSSPLGLLSAARLRRRAATRGSRWDAVRANTASVVRATAGAVPTGPGGSPRRSPTGARCPTPRSRVSSRSSAGSSPSAPTWPTTAGSTRRTAARSTTSCWRRSPGRSASWLMTRAESLGGVRRIRAVAPVSVIDEELEATSLGSQIAPHWVDLPVGEPSAVVRLHQVSYSFQAHRETGRGVAADRLAGDRPGSRPATFHAVGARVAAEELRRGFQLAVTNVPGPAVAAVRRRRPDARDLPGPPAAARPRAGDRRDVLRRRRCSTASPPTATCCPTPTCSASA